MAPYNVVLAFLISSSFSMLFQSQKAEAATRTTDSVSHCEKKCGEIDIPYPFGMKKGCYLDEPFEITCNQSTGSAKFLDAEVDAISFSNHTVRAKDFPVLNLPYNKLGGGGGLYNSNYYSISHTKNKFVAIGCNLIAYIIDGVTKDFVAGCVSLCGITDIPSSPPSSCLGRKCCQTNIDKDLRNYELYMEQLNTTTKPWKCGFLFFVDKNFPINKLNFSECESRYSVPQIFEWKVGNTSCKKAVGQENYVCGNNTVCIDSNIVTGYRCKCHHGFTGNPYLLDGCRDIDECADPKDNNCPMQNLCVNTEGSYYCSLKRKSGSAVPTIFGTSIPVGTLILVAIGLWIWRKLKKMNDRKTKQRFFKRNGGLLLQHHISSCGANVLHESTLFKIEELEKATDKFNESRVLGKGGLGTVYKGMLSDGRIVAVKKANIADESQVSQFINEVFILSQISHRHIVKLLGCCLETQVPLLVYEYVSNGTLSYHIHYDANTPHPTISWEDRLRIAAEVAEALAYLHSYASTAIFHRDIKSSNILLDEKYKAVVSDFGLSRSVSIDRTHLTTLVGGTFGYLDPEYFRSGQLNDKSDVYAFGVVLAEILTGQKAISSSKDDIGLAQRFQSAVKEHRLFEILEKVVADEGEKDEIIAVAKLAKRCLKVSARKRPSMKEVAAELDLLRKKREVPGHQESFRDEDHSASENCYTSEADSEVEADQTISKTD